ncbi:hypothetical protein GX586_10560 [bacterium]|nr:hypothetical protein [bacterium]
MGGITTSAITHAKRLMEETLRKSTTFHRRVATRQHKTQPGKTVVMGSHSIVTEWGIYRFTYWFSVPEDAWKTPQSDTLGRTSVCEAGSLWVFLYNWVLS